MFKKEDLKNRIKQGTSATIGTLALTLLTAYKGYHTRELEPDLKKLAIFSSLLAVASGALWSATPAAKKDPIETVKAVKDNIYPMVTLMIKRMAEDSLNESNDVKPTTNNSSYRRAEKEEDSWGFKADRSDSERWDEDDSGVKYSM